MDEIDLKILEILKKNSRTKFVSIGEAVNLTEGAVRRRIDKLLEEDIILKFTIESKLEFEAIVLIKIELEEIPRIKERVGELSERMFELAGEYDIASLIQAFTLEKLNEKIDNIRKIQGIIETVTLIKLVE